MLIAYTPTEWATTKPAVSIANGTWLTADAGTAGVDGKPTRKARYQAGGVCTITLTLPTAVPVRVAAILGLSGVAVGAAVSVAGVASTVQRFADGTLGAWFVLPVGGPVASVAFTLPAGTVDVGELVALPAVLCEHATSWQPELVDPSETARTRGASVAPMRLRAYRKVAATLTANTAAAVRQGGLDNGMDWQRLAVALSGDRPACVIPRWWSPGGGVNSTELNATAIYCRARLGVMPHLGGNHHSAEIVAEEVPAA